jgi:long-chain acyl-CoA synthetase
MDTENLAGVHRIQAERLGSRPALRYRRHHWWYDLSWQRYRADALACAAGLAAAGIAPGDRVGLLSDNRLEWLIADMGILTAGAVTVSPHAPLAARQVHFQLADAEARWLFLSGNIQLKKMRPLLAELPALKAVVVFDAEDGLDDATHWQAFLQGGRRAIREVGPELSRREAALRGDDLAALMYTSGTTGNPKGVMLTHHNLLSNARACQEASPRGPESLLLNWLPLSHIYARTVDHYLALVAGLTVALAGSQESLVEDLHDLQPTNLAGVPRFFEKVLAAVTTSDAEEPGRRLRKVFGPRMDWLTSGGAPLSLPVARAYQAAGLLLLQGYGLTESSPVISFNRVDAFRLESVGPPLPGVEVRIAADGEVLTRGPHVMKGYWNDPAATAEAIRDGWLHTGDLGRFDNGFLTITGRKKELMVLSNGKKVVPTFIEGLLLAVEGIEQAVVCGEGRSYIVALLVPQWDWVRRALRRQGTPFDQEDADSLANHPTVRILLQRQIDRAVADVAPWEQLKKFAVLPAPLTVEGGDLTVSLKMRRSVVTAKYAAVIDALYAETSEGC